jgi:hypothetical protein
MPETWHGWRILTTTVLWWTLGIGGPFFLRSIGS